jgi:hypothetical protein
VVLANLALVSAALFALAGLLKFTEHWYFVAALEAYGIRGTAARFTGIALPVVEIGVALAYIAGLRRGLAAAAMLVMLLIFSVAVIVALQRGVRTVSCACFGRSSQELSWGIVVRNAVLAAPLIAVLVRPASGPTFDVQPVAQAAVTTALLAAALQVVGLRAQLRRTQ